MWVGFKVLYLGCFICLIFLTGCSVKSELTDEQKAEIQTEITRLSGLTARSEVVPSDFESLNKLIESDSIAKEEVEEIVTLVEYDEFKHVGHGLSFLSTYINVGKETICPPHELAHYYVFMKHGEKEKADHAHHEAEEQFDEWNVKAREYNEKYPAVEDFDTVANIVQKHLEDIESGDDSATPEEIDYLTGEGSICVEG